MFNFAVNWVGVIVAAIAAMIIGMLWYSPMLFGKIWAKETGVNVQKSMKTGRAKMLIPAFIASLITAFVLAVVILNAQSVTLTHAVEAAVLVWFGFTLSYQMVRMSFESTSMAFFLEEVLHQLVIFVIMAIILVLLWNVVL